MFDNAYRLASATLSKVVRLDIENECKQSDAV